MDTDTIIYEMRMKLIEMEADGIEAASDIEALLNKLERAIKHEKLEMRAEHASKVNAILR